MATILWTYIPKEVEIEMKSLAEELEARGHSLFIVYHSNTEILKKWKVNAFPSKNFSINKDDGSANELLEKWGDRVFRWGAFKGQDPDKTIKNLHSYYHDILEKTSPDLVVIWNPMSYTYGILGDVARSKGVKCLYSERGLVSPGFFLDMDGVFGYSSIKSTGKEFFDRPDYKALGLSYLKKLDVDSLSLYKQEGRIEKKITKNSRERKILILGSHEMQCGMHPPESNDRKKVLPFFTGNEEMVIYLLQEIDNAIVIFKPHPHSDINLSELIDNKNFFVSNSNPNSLIAISDVVISNCSKLEMNVVAKNKPLVLPGFGLLWNKGCAYDAGSKAEFSELVSECLKKHSKADEFFDALTGYLGFIIKDQHFLGKFSFENNVSSEADDIKGFADYFLDRLELSRYGNGKIELSAHVFIRDQLLDNNFVYSSLKDLFRVEVPNIYRFMTFFSPKRYFLKIKKILNSLGGL